MMEEKKKSNNILIAFIVILLLVCVGMGVFIFMNKDKLLIKEISKETVNTKKQDVKDSVKKCEEINYDLNTSEFGLSANGAGIAVHIDKTRKSATISYNGATLNKAFGLQWVTSLDEVPYEIIDTKTFDKKIVQVLVDGSGQSARSTAILYLMEDGTVEYVPILKDINTNWQQPDNTKKFNSYGSLEGITNIISLIPAEGNGYHTVLARKVDGTVIDLSTTFTNTGNF